LNGDDVTTDNDTLPGNLDGTVVNEQGSTLPGAVLTVLGNPFPQVQVSNALGEFRFLSLQAGNYNLSVQLEGVCAVGVSRRHQLRANHGHRSGDERGVSIARRSAARSGDAR
jgi:hypothetical protein